MTASGGRALHSAEVVLDTPRLGLLLPPLTWSQRALQTPDSMLTVFS